MSTEDDVPESISRPRPKPRSTVDQSNPDQPGAIAAPPIIPKPRKLKIAAPNFTLEDLDPADGQIGLDPDTGKLVLNLAPVPDAEFSSEEAVETTAIAPTRTPQQRYLQNGGCTNNNNVEPNGNNRQPTICYQTPHGQTATTRENVVNAVADGYHVVVTPERTWVGQGRILKEKDLKVYKILSVIAILFFFPSGLLALYYAHKTHKEFYAGLERGEVDTAKKMAKRCEKCLVLTVISCILLIALLVAIFGKTPQERSRKLSPHAASFRHFSDHS
ncbi:uncharacterized protein LOC141902589 [Tubulanus polymorphus]|uniref:uncharacterized protein LOC141902589 n=1 Tax=Tubulanus polymorphus TaxID=672921 RepID=UPI003DA55330